jgi:hypothetical protein
MSKLIAALILCVVIAAAALAMAGAAPVDYLSALISLAALVVSLLAAFKEDLFPFRPRVLLDEVTLAAPGPTNRLSPSVLLPLSFINDGHGSGVIEGLTLKIETGANAKVYTPVAEIDYAKFLSGRRIVHAENMRHTFNPFVLGARATVNRCFLFVQENASTRYPFTDWAPGKHVFRLYMKHSAASSPTVVGQVSNTISPELLAGYQAGTSSSLAPGRELHV